MKAKELAELLLKNPDMDVFLEETNFDDWDCSVYYTPSEVVDIQITPSGVFIKHNPMHRQDTTSLKMPSTEPVVGSLRVVLNCPIGELLCFSNDTSNHVQSFVEELLNYGSVSDYVSFIDEHIRFVSQQTDVNYSTESGYVLSPDDCTYEVLTSYDDDWNCTYTEMTYDEMTEYAYANFDIKKYEDL